MREWHGAAGCRMLLIVDTNKRLSYRVAAVLREVLGRELTPNETSSRIGALNASERLELFNALIEARGFAQKASLMSQSALREPEESELTSTCRRKTRC